jgi:hypothetical protein
MAFDSNHVTVNGALFPVSKTAPMPMPTIYMLSKNLQGQAAAAVTSTLPSAQAVVKEPNANWTEGQWPASDNFQWTKN